MPFQGLRLLHRCPREGGLKRCIEGAQLRRGSAPTGRDGAEEVMQVPPQLEPAVEHSIRLPRVACCIGGKTTCRIGAERLGRPGDDVLN
jgi:hypothetical protein